MPKPIIPWPGGKRRLASQILPLFDKAPHTTYVEPFAGGAALLFAREPAKAEVLNDIDGELVRLYRCVRHHLDELVRQFRWALTSREMFKWAQLENPDTLTDIQRAARYFYLQKLCFGGKVTGRTFGVAPQSRARFDLTRIGEDLSEAHMRLAHVTIEHLPWQECMARYDRPETLFYLDPPYWRTAGYGVPFGLEQYEAMATVMASLKGKAILSVNDHPDMRQVFAAFRCQPLRTTYKIGGNDRPKQATELLIATW